MRKFDIAKRNEEFQAMSPEQKRVAVAKDVIMWLDAKRMRPRTSNGYITKRGLPKAWKQRDYSDLLFEGPACNVCAIGAVFMATVGWQDDCPIDRDLRTWPGTSSELDKNRESIIKYLRGVFDAGQLLLMEKAFETTYRERPSGFFQRDAILFGARFKGADNRLRGIMENIIANNGTFDPTVSVATAASGDGSPTPIEATTNS